MKPIAIIILWITALVVGFATISHGQIPDQSHPTDTILLADETTITWDKSEAKITSCNQKAFDKIFKSHGTLFIRFKCNWMHGRKGSYKLYTAYVNKQDAKLIINWAKTNL